MTPDLITQARERIAILHASSAWGSDEDAILIEALVRRVEELTERVEQLEAALRFYADNHENPNDGPWGVNSDDFGSIARLALQETGDD